MKPDATPLCAVGCGAPCADAYICNDCTAKLIRDLRDVVNGLLDDLETSYLRQTRFGAAGGGSSRSAQTALPWDDRASTVATSVTVLIERWAWRIAATSCATAWPHDGVIAAAAFLLDRVEWIRHNADGVAAYRSLHAGIGRVLHVVDRPAEAWYAGPCWAPPLAAAGCPCACHGDPDRIRPECSIGGGCHLNHREGVVEQLCAAPLYARPKATTVTCRICRTDWLVDKLRAHLMTASHDWLATATEIARAVTLLGEHVVTPERIRQWKARGRIEPRGYLNTDDETGPRYRIGDVIDLLSEDAGVQARRAAKRDQRERTAS